MKRTRTLALAACLALVAASCDYADMAGYFRSNGDPLPWWCAPTEEIPVTDGPASGNIDWYAGTHKEPLTWEQCERLSAQLDAAIETVSQWPTAADAAADGWQMVMPYYPGMGTHHTRNGFLVDLLKDPNFDRFNPILDEYGMDDVFDPANPEVLQYDGNGPDAKLIGFDYYVRTDNGLPPEGFEGNNDWWHHHPWICFSKTDGRSINFNTSDATCNAQGGVNVNMSNYYMLHAWVLEDMVYTPDVYAGMIPCITVSGAIYDTLDPCHTGGAHMSMDHGADAATHAGH
jgi:hypothetical protein